MNDIAWTQDYSVDDPIIDAQHRQLIDTMNHLAGLLAAGRPSLSEATAVFGRLAVYVLDHFSYEEERMERAGYPADDLARHKAIHAGLTQQVRAFKARVDAGDLAALSDLLPFLQGTWLLDHIRGTDRLYAPCLAAARQR